MQLVRLQAQGLSFGAISRELGPPFTRSACIGKFHRLVESASLARMRRELGLEEPAAPAVEAPQVPAIAPRAVLPPLPPGTHCTTPGCRWTRQPYSSRGLCAECTTRILTDDWRARHPGLAGMDDVACDDDAAGSKDPDDFPEGAL